MRRQGLLQSVQGMISLHGQFEERAYAARSRRLAEEQRHLIETAAPSTDLGHGRLADLADASRAGLLDPRGLFLGALGGRMLFFSGDEHLLTYARTGGGKGRDLILNNLAHVRDRSLVVVDVKDGENAYASHRHRGGTLQQRCIFLNPFGLQGHPNTRVNPFQTLIDTVKAGREIDTEADEIALILIPHGKGDEGDNGWVRKGARRLISVSAEYLARFEQDRCRIGTVWSVVNSSTGALQAFFGKMAACGKAGIAGRAAALASVFEDAPKQFEAYRAEAIDALVSFEPGKTLERSTAGHDFDFSRLKQEPCTVYLMAPSEKLGVVAPWISLVVNLIIEAIARAPGPIRTTFLLDEFPQLPPAPAIPKALRLYRGKGLNLWMFSQGRYSLESRWSREMVREFEDQAQILNFWAVEDQSLIKDITLWSGQRTIRRRSISQGGGVVETAGANLGEMARPVLQAEDIRSISDRRQIVRVAGHPYLFVAERVPYFEVDPWKDQLLDVRALHRGDY